MKKKLMLLTLIGALFSVNVFAEDFVSLRGEARKSNYSKIVYKDSKIYEVYGQPLNATAIKFGVGEVIKNVSFSDPLNWSGAIASDNQLYIKPAEYSEKSTLFITTNKRDYYLNLYVEEGLYNPVIEFVYPQEQQMLLQNIKAMQQEEENRRIKLELADIKDINNNYTWKTRYDWSPTNIFDIGGKTYIFLSVENKDMPTVFEKINKNEWQILIPVVSENKQGQKVLIINKVCKEMYLALHKEKIYIRNKSR